MKGVEGVLLESLLEFYDNYANFSKFLKIVVFKESKLSIRLIDWYVTNYCKKNDIFYTIGYTTGYKETFKVYRSYETQLMGYKKKYFDPFCRGKTMSMTFEDPKTGKKYEFDTAICQLNFFKWAIKNLVLEHIEKNYDAIYADMNSVKRDKSKKRKELSKSIHKTLNIHHVKV